MKGVVIALALVLPNASLAQDWWQGIWTANPDWCAVADQVGAITPAPISISATELLEYENSCEISDAQAMDSIGAVRLHVVCQSEGDTYDEERLLMRVDDAASAIWMWFGAGDPIRFQRCK